MKGGDLVTLLVRLQLASHHADEGGLPRSVLAQQDNDLAVGELARIHLQVKVTHGFLHTGIVVPRHPLHLLLGGVLRHLEDEGVLTEPEILRRNKAVQEDVDAFPHRKGHCDDAVSTWYAVQTADEVRQVVQHGEIVFHHDNVLVRMY